MYTSQSPTFPASTRPRYKYQPLHRSTQGLLRLLRVLSSRREGRLQVELRLVDWSTEYRCLSYMWGEPSSEKHEILLDGCMFSVRDNLYRFLELACTRYPHEPFWIDAVCINQASTLEKSVEVRRMHVIYTRAKEVIIWLGVRFPEPPASQSDDMEACNGPVMPAQTAIDYICNHPYWYRTWVTQEVILAKSLTILCGGETFDWDCAVLVNSSPSHNFWALWRDRQARLEGPRDSQFNKSMALFPFWRIFYWRILSQCTDPRDRIYGLLALASDYPGFGVDYTEDVVDLFWRAGEYFEAWAIPDRTFALRKALKLDWPTLAKRAPSGISVRVIQIQPRVVQASPGAMVAYSCPDGDACVPISVTTRHARDVFLCTPLPRRTDHEAPGIIASLHVLLSSRKSNDAEAYAITLFTSRRNSPPLTTTLPRITLHISETGNWRYSTYGAADEQDFVQWANSQTARGMLCLPASYVTEHLREYFG